MSIPGVLNIPGFTRNHFIIKKINKSSMLRIKIFIFSLICLSATAQAQDQEIVFNRIDSASTNTAILNIGKPAVLSASDLIIIHIQINNGYNLTPPAGFTTLASNITGNLGYGTFYRIADGTEAATFSFTSSNTTQWLTSTIVVRNVNTKSPFESTAFSSGTIAGSTGAINTPAVTPSTANGLLLLFGSVRHTSAATGTITEPAGTTLVHKKVSALNLLLMVGSESLSSSAAVGARTVNFTPLVASGSASNRCFYSVALVIRKASRTLFSYQSGNFNDPTSWTLDPSGTTLTPATGTLPAVYDSLVVLNGRTISLTANTNAPWIGLQLAQGSVFNLSTFTIDSLTCISGKGRLRSARNNTGFTYFPTVFGNNRPILQADGGIVEYYVAANVVLNNTITGYHSLELKREGSGTGIYTLASDITLTGNLSVTRTGTAVSRLLFGNSATARNLTVTGDVNVQAGGEIQVATYNITHQLSIAGSLNNYGSCRFTNRTTPDYLTDATDGIVEVTFTGNSDKEINCYGVTDFYRMIVNKGTDQTFLLTVNVSSALNFRLLGRNDQANTGADPNPIVLKSLFIENGTLRLKSNISIPSLTEGGNDFFIGLNACLWVDGANVYSCASGAGSRGITVIGKFRLTSGSVNTLASAGLVYRTDAQVIIEGGTLTIGQFRRSSNVGDYRTSYTQTGGSVIVTGQEDNADYSRFSLPFSDCAFTMSGGTLELRSPVTVATNNMIDIQVSALNYSVTGGEIIINSNNAAIQPVIYSSGAFYNLTIIRNSGGDVVAGGALNIINKLLAGSGSPVLSMNNYNLTVSGDLVINTGATLVSGTNTLTFNGAGKQLLTVNGTLSGNLNNLVIDKASDTLELSGSVSSVIVAGSFSLNAGIFQDGGKTFECRNAVNLSGRHIGAGKILLSNVNTRTLTGDGNGVFTNVEFNAPSNADITVNCNLRILGTLTFTGTTRRVIDMGANLMVLDTFSRIVNPGTNRFIRFNGNQSAGGLTKVFDSLAFTFPIGSGTGVTYDYTPATITFSTAPGNYGSLNVKPVSSAHPALTASGRSLDCYWRTTATGFTLGGATVSHSYAYVQTDVLTGTGILETDYVPAVFNTISNTWTSGSSLVDATNNLVTFSGATFGTTLTGEFTAGDNSPINPFAAVTVYYSRVNNGPWATLSTWTTNPDHTTIATPATVPGANSIVRIGNGTSVFHNIEVNANSASSGTLIISTGSTLNLNATTGHSFGAVSGESGLAKGRLRIGRPAATYSFPAGDFGIFLSAGGGEVEYYCTLSSDVTLPVLPVNYNKLIFNTSGTGNIYLPNANLIVYDSLIVKSTGTGEVGTNLTNAASGNLTIGKSLVISGGKLEINNPGAASSKTISIEGDLRVYNGCTFAVAATGTALTHQLSIRGNIVNDGTFNLRPSANFMANCTFTGSDTSRITGTNAGSSTTLNGLTINKGSSQNAFFEINVPGNLFTQTNGWLTLQNGTFRFSKASTITVWNTDVAYEIPLSVKFSVNNTGAIVNMGAVAGDAADLVLRGKLEILNGTVNVGTSTNNSNNDIEIASAGQPEIEVTGAGVLNVNGQIRRGLATLSGSLVYRQSGTSTVLVRGRNTNTVRGKFEVLNTGSYFSMSGTPVLQLLRGGSVNFADLYVRPDSTSVSGGTVLLKPTGVGSSQSYTIDVIHTFYNLNIENDVASNAVADLTINPLAVKSNLTVTSGGTLNTNSLDVSIGEKFTKSGTYNGGTTELTFVSNAGVLEGVFSSQPIYALKLDSAAVLKLTGATTSIRIDNELNISRNAEFYDSSKLVEVRGDIINAGTHISNANSGTTTLVMAGTVAQEISGGGIFGNMVINNPMGVFLRSSITVNRLVTLNNGIFDINEYLLNIGSSGDISGTYSVTRMIRANGVLSDGGIKRNINAGAVNLFYPLGVLGKYAPANINISSNNAAGSITVKPVNSKHPSTRLAADSQLTFYWQVDTTGLGTLQATHTYTYNNQDVTGTEANYRTGKYIFPNWSPLSGIAGTVNASANTITLTSVNYVGGGFTAGAANEFGGVSTYYSRKTSGNWDRPGYVVYQRS
jgi:fibronectin-binding autotransporter adhesin